MSYYGYRVYGDSYLAETLRCGLAARCLRHERDKVGADVLAFVAQDVLDHSDQEQLTAVARCFECASRGHQYVVVVSQVPPGWTRKIAGDRVRSVFYQVDTIIMQNAVERVVRPEQFIVGCANSGELLPLIYQEYLSAHNCPVLRMSYEEAELAKCAINYALDAQIRMANELSAVAALLDASWDQVRKALAGDARIGPHAYLRPGQPNQHLQRDVYTINNLLLTFEE